MSATSRPAGSGSLTVVGTGIQLVRQLTPEARDALEQAEEVLYVVADPVTAAWLESVNPGSRSLSTLYRAGPPRSEIYAEMVDEILAAVRRGSRVCAVFYGHPGVYVRPSHEAVKRARAEGYPAQMLPAISAEACLFADLGIDPAERGWQSYEATEFLLRGHELDPTAGLVLWQVDAIGKLDWNPSPEPRGLHVLAERLRELYAPEHEVIFYRASTYPIAGPQIDSIALQQLAGLTAAPGPTLYVPPLPRRPIDDEMALRLGIRPS
jgi:precorrin-6B methylase 1